jgi:DNA-binding NarL/FixJ family response regulator
MKEPIKVILAEDHKLFRTSLKALFKDWPRFEIVGEASNGRELIDLLKVKPADVVLLDLEMKVMDGLSALKIIKQRFKEIKTLILSNHSDTAYLNSIVAMGANGFLLKDCEAKQLAEAIEKVYQGETYFIMNNERVRPFMPNKESFIKDVNKKLLNSKEIEILKNICDGKTNKEIASILNLSASTIDFYKSRIYSKTNCNNATSLLKYALRNNIINLMD